MVEAFEGADIKKDYIRYDDPIDILSTLLKMSVDDSILYYFLKKSNSGFVRDRADYNELKKIFVRLRITLKETFGEKFKDGLYLSLFKLGRLYGMPPIKKLKQEDVYIGGFSFYKRHEDEFTITFSTSSGLLNPLERVGTDIYVQKYSISPNKIDDLSSVKNPYRIYNFSEGILNNNINCKRIYIWEKEGNSRALKEALEKVPKEKKQEFLDDAVNLLCEAFMFDKIKILEIEKFKEWMKRFTRNAKDEIMFSIRGPESGKITHAIHINFNLEDMERKRRRIQRIFVGLSILAGLADQRAGLAINFLVGGEEIFYSLLESTIKKPINFEKEINKIGYMIKDYRGLNHKSAQKRAEKIIERLI